MNRVFNVFKFKTIKTVSHRFVEIKINSDLPVWGHDNVVMQP